MTRGTILDAARTDSRGFLGAAFVLFLVCGAVVALNWKYVYNFLAGPFPFDQRLSDAPGAREFVRAEGPALPTGMVQETTFRLLRGLAETKSVSASYLAMLEGDRILVVKVRPEFSGNVVEGRLVRLPEAVRQSFGSGVNPHPWMVDAHLAYRWDFNLFILVAGPLFPLTMLLVGVAAWRATSPQKHPAIARLASSGPPLQVVQRIESEMAAAGPTARAGPLWISPSWIVALAPSLQIHRVADLIGVGHQTTVQKAGAKHELRFWTRDKIFSDDLAVPEPDAGRAMQAVRSRFPGLVVDDTAGFDRRWQKGRKVVQSEVDARMGRATPAG
jgi:hypothetical protein